MKKLGLILAVIVVGIGVAITYHVFENIVHAGIDLVWYEWFDTDNNRLLVVPLAFVLSFVYFGLQHALDEKAEQNEEQGLGHMAKPTLSGYVKVLLLGFFSLLAGASLGPEAILVPACMMLGALAGARISKDPHVIKLLTAAGIIALFTAFFHSLIVGILSVLLVTKQAKTTLSPVLLLTTVVAATTSYATLTLLSGDKFLSLPHYNWRINAATLVISVVLAGTGYVMIFGMEYAHKAFKKIQDKIQRKDWFIRASAAACGLSILYLLGGPLVEFTGNNAIVPLFNEAASLGLVGLVWVLAVKIAAISWSKAAGYRGGMIFPTIFLAAVMIAMVQLYVNDFNMIYGLVAVLAGTFAANAKTGILA